MKKLSLLLILTLAFFNCTYAQWSTGIKGGLNLSTIHTSNDLVSGYLPGFNAGIYYNYEINDIFEFQPELLYSRQGYKWDMIICNSAGQFVEKNEVKYRTHNLNVPLLMRVNVFKILSIDAGPQFGFNLGKHATGEPAWGVPKSKRFDFGIVMGAGVRLSDRVRVTGYYCLGLSQTLKDKLLDIENKKRSESRVIQFSVSYRLF